MKKEIAKIWVEALRSGKYKQGKSNLVNEKGQYCCLGVLCELAVQNGIIPPATVSRHGNIYFSNESMHLPTEVMRWAGMNTNSGAFAEDEVYTDLEVKNDTGSTFNEIADIIEREVDKL